MTHAAVQLTLEGVAVEWRSRDPLASSHIAQTIGTVEKRLGISTQGFITYLFVCDVCWKVHEPEELPHLPDNGRCTDDDCPGVLFRTKRAAEDHIKRVPVKTMPFVEPKNVVAHILSCQGKFDQLQLWRGPGDEPGERVFVDQEGYDAFEDLDRPMNDVYDGWGWRAIQAGLEQRWNGSWTLEEVNVHELAQQFVAFPCGLVWQMNIDWFQAISKGKHSTGAVYLTLCNNPRGIRYLREETALVLVIPGPHEPSLEQMNECLKFIVRGFSRLYKGVDFHVYGYEDKIPSHSFVLNDVSDLPASRKAAGLAAHNSKAFMCPCCRTPHSLLSDPRCFAPDEFELRDDWRYLKYSFRARDSPPDVAESIFELRGVRWSELNRLPGWLPSASSPIDFMHCVMLCMIKHLNRVILHAYGMYNTPNRNDESMISKMEGFFSQIIWPSSVGRLPPSVACGSGSVKADQWRSQILVLPVALYVIWGNDGQISDGTAPTSSSRLNITKSQAKYEKIVRSRLLETFLRENPNATEDEMHQFDKVTMERSYRPHYNAVIEFTAAIRVLASRSITPAEVQRGFKMLSRALQSWARMHCHLTPYFHLALHMEASFLKFGPCYGWWTFPYERNNGFLGRFNHNGHTGGEIEGTMMRGWWKSIFIQKLIAHFEDLPERSFEDEDSLKLLKSKLKGDKTKRGGTLQTYLSQLGVDKNQVQLRLGGSGKDLYLRDLGPGYYRLVFVFLKNRWRNDLQLCPNVEMGIQPPRVAFNGCAASFSHCFWQERRYGAARSVWGLSAQYAYIGHRIPVRIQYIFQVTQPHYSDRFADLVATFAIVQRFLPPEADLRFPWDIRAVDLGVQVWSAEQLGDIEVVGVDELSGHFILAPLTSHEHDLWVTIAYDHDKPEHDDNDYH
ncbi:hypothetical protein BDN72DRAFT_803396 [Pluteus cervinus]|uniref:Uncharacterized protein n=1 Tax=Pluteus cervinus TaxID=181527 RepID=A0ACD3ACH0_9AGAR|nr:hypothetical protein BDN72DRAFT_803396 [Pluteus cervinus]